MALFDQGGGCSCGLNKFCDCKDLKGIINYNLDSSKINYKYKEDEIIDDFKSIIDKTYSEHYKTTNDLVECFDCWIALDDATPTFRNTAIKYLWRYGKKNGNNKDDLMKALHYTLMCLYNDHYRNKK